MMESEEENQVEEEDTLEQHECPTNATNDDTLDKDMAEDRVAIVPHLSLFSTVAVCVGSVVGSGLFISPKGVLAGSGSPGLALVMWVACGVISLVGSLCYAEIGAMLPLSGGNFSYLRFMYGELVAFLYLWGTIVVSLPAGCAVLALLFAEYLLQPFFINTNDLLCCIPQAAVWCLAIVCLFTATMVNLHSAKFVTIVNNVLSSCKVVSLCVIIFAGFLTLFQGKTENFQDPFRGSTYHQLGGAFYSGLFSYAGWYGIGMVGGEIKNPQKNLPRAVFTSMLFIVTITVLTNVAYLAVLSPEEMLQADAVAVTFGNKALGSAAFLMPVSIALATVGSLNSSIFAYARLYHMGAKKKHLPKLLSMINIHRRTPIPSVLSISSTILMYIFVPDLFTLINFHGCFTWLFCGATVLGQVVIRFRQPEIHRPYKISILVHMCFVLICVFLLVLGTMSAPIDTAIGIGVILTGVPVYFLLVRPQKQLKWIQIVLRSVTHWMQKLFLIIEEEE